MDDTVIVIPETVWRKFLRLRGLIDKSNRIPLYEIERKQQLEEIMADIHHKTDEIIAASKEVVFSEFHEDEFYKAKADELKTELDATNEALKKAQGAIRYRDDKIKDLNKKFASLPEGEALTPKQIARAIKETEERIRKETIIEMMAKNEEAIEAALERAENGKNNSPKSKDQ